MDAGRTSDGQRSCAVESGHRSYRVLHPTWLRESAFQCCRNYTCADRLCKNQNITRNRTRVYIDAVRLNQPGNGVSKFDLRIADAVPTYYNTLGLAHFRHATAHDLFKNI